MNHPSSNACKSSVLNGFPFMDQKGAKKKKKWFLPPHSRTCSRGTKIGRNTGPRNDHGSGFQEGPTRRVVVGYLSIAIREVEIKSP